MYNSVTSLLHIAIIKTTWRFTLFDCSDVAFLLLLVVNERDVIWICETSN